MGKMNHLEKSREKIKSWKINFEEKKSHENKWIMWKSHVKNESCEKKLILERNACEKY